MPTFGDALIGGGGGGNIDILITLVSLTDVVEVIRDILEVDTTLLMVLFILVEVELNTESGGAAGPGGRQPAGTPGLKYSGGTEQAKGNGGIR